MKRRFQRRAGGDERRMVTLNVVPLIDVVFFLLVFYVINASFNRETSVGVSRPESTQSRLVTQPYVAVAVLKSGSIWIRQQQLTKDTLPSGVAAALRAAQTERVIIQADREVPTGALLNVMDACRNGGATRVDIAAQLPGAKP